MPHRTSSVISTLEETAPSFHPNKRERKRVLAFSFLLSKNAHPIYSMPAGNIHPISDKLIVRTPKKKLRLSCRVFWFCGLSGSGKSTIALCPWAFSSTRGIHSVVLDGDNLRAGNQGLGFSDEDRMENIRRTAEIAKLLVQNGLVVIVSLITPLARHRKSAAKIIGPPDYHEIFVKASFHM